MNKKKLSIIIAATVLGCILVFAGVGLFAYRNDIATVASVSADPESGICTVNYTADYDIDTILNTKGVSSSEELVSLLKNGVFKNIKLRSTIDNIYCEGFAFMAKNSDGGYLSGRNYNSESTDIVVVKTTPKKGYASTSIAPLKALGIDSCANMTNADKVNLLLAPYAAIDGVNEKGLSVSLVRLNAVCPETDRYITDVTPSVALRALLDKAKDVESAVTMLKTLNMKFAEGESWQFLISDNDGSSVVVSYETGAPTVTERQNPFLACSGAFLNDTSIGYKKTGSTNYEKGLAVLRNNLGEFTADQSIDMLDYLSIKKGKGDISTQWSVIFELDTASVQLCPDTEYAKVYTYEIK